MGLGNEFVKPQLPAGQELTGEHVNKIFTQRSVWLLPSEKLGQLNDLSEEKVWMHYLYAFFKLLAFCTSQYAPNKM